MGVNLVYHKNGSILTKLLDLTRDSMYASDTNAIYKDIKVLGRDGNIIIGTAFKNRPNTQTIPIHNYYPTTTVGTQHKAKIVYGTKTVIDLHSVGMSSDLSPDKVRFGYVYHDQNGKVQKGTFLDGNPSTYTDLENLTTSSGSNLTTSSGAILQSAAIYKLTSQSTTSLTYTKQT